MRTILIIIFMTFSCFIASGQVEIKQEINLNSIEGYTVLSIYETLEGDLILAGNCNNKSVTKGKTDYWIAKTTSTGTLIWQYTYGGSGQDQVRRIQPTIDGGFLIAGFSNSCDGDISDYIGEEYHPSIHAEFGRSNFWLIKVSQNGKLIWSKSIGGNKEDRLNDLQISNDGNFILAGSYGSIIHSEKAAAWILKLDQNGNILWENKIIDNDSQEAVAIRENKINELVFVGIRKDSLEDKGKISYDLLIGKLSAEGKLIWDKVVGGSSKDYPYSLEKAYNGGYIITGESKSSDENVKENYGKQDIWTFKIDEEGNIIWSNIFGGSKIDKGLWIESLKEGGYIIAGGTYSNDNGIKIKNPGRNYLIFKINEKGITQWHKTFSKSEINSLYQVKQLANGNLILAGSHKSKHERIQGKYNLSELWILEVSIDKN